MLTLSTSPNGLTFQKSGLCFSNIHFVADLGKDGTIDSRVAQIKTESQGSTETLHFLWPQSKRPFEGKATVKLSGEAFTWSLLLRPSDGKKWELCSTTELSGTVTGWTNAPGVDMFHADNIRGIHRNHDLFKGTYFTPITDWKTPANAGRWQSFTGLWLRERPSNLSFITGVLSQSAWRHLDHAVAQNDHSLLWKGLMLPPGIPKRCYHAGEYYQGEEIYFEIGRYSNPLASFQNYIEELLVRLNPAKKNSLLSEKIYWDSWNDRKPHFWNVSDSLLERTAAAAQQFFPSICALEIDDGYAHTGIDEIQPTRWNALEQGLDSPPPTIKIPRRLGSAFMAEPDMAIARDRFPHGMAQAARNIETAGYIPAIWLGIDTVTSATLVKEHPEWFIRYTPSPFDDPDVHLGYNSPNHHPIPDPSHPEARHYLESVFDLLFKNWKYQAFKLDFWSQPFEILGYTLQIQDRTAYEWRNLFFATIRNRLPEKSFLCLGCDISTGSPFLSNWVDNIRYGIDIGNGKWSNIVYSALTGTFLLHVQTFRFYILNSDSIGLLRQLPDQERRVFWAWAAITRSMCEIAGDLGAQPREDLRTLQRLTLAPKNGHPAWTGEWLHIERNEPAAIVCTEGDHFSTVTAPYLPERMVAVFNWSEEPRSFTVTPETLGLPGNTPLLDVEFYESRVETRTGAWTVHLAPHSVSWSHLTTREPGVPKILHSAWRVDCVTYRDQLFTITMTGDSAEGALIDWPNNSVPAIKNSSLEADCEAVCSHVYHIRPRAATSVTTQWEITIESAHKS